MQQMQNNLEAHQEALIKIKKCRLNKNKYQFSPKRKSCYTNDISPLISQQTIVAANLDIPLNIHNQFNNERNNNNTTIMREYNSVHCQTDDNTESKCNTKATLRLTCNDEMNEYNTYNKSNILEEDKSIN